MRGSSTSIKRFAESYPDGYYNYPDPNERIEFWDQYLKEFQEIYDDSIPNAYLSEFDQGLYGALVGGSPRFISDTKTGWISSMVPPLLQRWDDFMNLKLDENCFWYKVYVEQLKIFRDRAYGKFGISHFILIDSLNFVFELRGATQTYLDIMDNPAMVESAIDFAYHLNKRKTPFGFS